MKNFLCKLMVGAMAIILVQLCALNVQAATPAQGVSSGGRGATEVAAVEDMKLAAVKRALARLTERNDDPASPYQQLLANYSSFVKAAHVDKRGKNSRGHFVTGKVEIDYDRLREEFGLLVKNSHGGDVSREVYLFVRVVADATEDQISAAEDVILQRYMTRLRENKFVVANADEVTGELSQTRSMTFGQFVEFVKRKTAENPAICTAVVGEIRPAQISADANGYTAACEMTIRALDCLRGFAVIDSYDGSEILRMKEPSLVENLLCEKAAVSSSKSVIDSLIRYWSGKI